ncbi:MAG: hypothetical protein AVDCRST_MAG40-18, partial [uncultured Gemmatimonadaceae bacterium]
ALGAARRAFARARRPRTTTSAAARLRLPPSRRGGTSGRGAAPAAV